MNQAPLTKDGRYVLLRLTEKRKRLQPPADLVIWNYEDDKLASEIKSDGADMTVLVDLRQRKAVKIFRAPFEKVRAFGKSCLLVEQHTSDFSPIEVFWNAHARPGFMVYALETKKIRSLPIDRDFAPFPRFSPDGLHLIGFDYRQNSYASFQVTTGTYRELNKGADIRYPVYDSKIIQSVRPLSRPEPIWSAKKGVFFIHDENDVWRFNLLKDEAPVCITNFYGRRNSIKFQLLEATGRDIPTAANLLLAFNVKDKTNGFYRWSEHCGEDPVQLICGNFVYMLPESAWSSAAGFTPLKASGSDTYLLRRMSATESPNYFITKDFKKIIQLSHVQPEIKVNWLTTELIHWKSRSGTELSGVLYKPENFDNQKKYPLIFHYYERKSDELNQYKYPDPGMGDLSIAFFVSNGYLVFCPDIEFTKKGPAVDALECIQSAVFRLSQLFFIDMSKLGLQGNSFGGYITNYLVGHSESFAAACSSAGIIDLIAYSGRLEEINSGESMRDGVQFGQNRMNETLWQNPQKYISNSPIFNVDRIRTPMLLEYGRRDARMYIEGVNFFTALRRLQKPAWLLDYVNAGHGPVGKDANDYTIKMYQFFNHYLKGAPSPSWMAPSFNQ
jgi:dienelactone hydrolase